MAITGSKGDDGIFRFDDSFMDYIKSVAENIKDDDTSDDYVENGTNYVEYKNQANLQRVQLLVDYNTAVMNYDLEMAKAAAAELHNKRQIKSIIGSETPSANNNLRDDLTRSIKEIATQYSYYAHKSEIMLKVLKDDYQSKLDINFLMRQNYPLLTKAHNKIDDDIVHQILRDKKSSDNGSPSTVRDD